MTNHLRNEFAFFEIILRMHGNEQIERLVKIAPKNDDQFRSNDFKTRLAAIDAIATYGDAAIPALVQISEESTNNYVRKWACNLRGLFSDLKVALGLSPASPQQRLRFLFEL